MYAGTEYGPSSFPVYIRVRFNFSSMFVPIPLRRRFTRYDLYDLIFCSSLEPRRSFSRISFCQHLTVLERFLFCGLIRVWMHLLRREQSGAFNDHALRSERNDMYTQRRHQAHQPKVLFIQSALHVCCLVFNLFCPLCTSIVKSKGFSFRRLYPSSWSGIVGTSAAWVKEGGQASGGRPKSNTQKAIFPRLRVWLPGYDGVHRFVQYHSRPQWVRWDGHSTVRRLSRGRHNASRKRQISKF